MLENQENNNNDSLNNQQPQLLNLHDFINFENIAYCKILAFLIVQDSISSQFVHNCYFNIYSSLKDSKYSPQEKLNLIGEIIGEQKTYIDYVLQIMINAFEIILNDDEINDLEKLDLIERIAEEFNFIASDKNEIGRVYTAKERILLALSRLIKLIAPNNKNNLEANNFIEQTKIKIYNDIQDYLLFHLQRTEEIYKKLTINNELNQFLINEEELNKIKENNQEISEGNLKYYQQLINVLNDEKLLIKHKVEYLLIILATQPYYLATALILGLADLSLTQSYDLDFEKNFLQIKNYYCDLYQKEILSQKKGYEISNIGKKTKTFFIEAKEEIETAIDQLNATANLIRSNSVE